MSYLDLIVVSAVSLCTIASSVRAADSYAPPAAGVILQTLKNEHPRLLISTKTARQVRSLVARDEVAARIYAALAEGRSGDIMDLLWFDPVTRMPDAESVPLDKLFRKVECGSMRDRWGPGKGFIVAIQGGDNGGAVHRHLDLGTFILEVDGVRWIIDSGKEPETYQRHRNQQKRNDFCRIRAEGHNTLVFNPDRNPDQNPRGTAAFTPLRSEPTRATTSLDLTQAYADDAAKVVRTFTLDRGKRFTVTDEIVCKNPSTVWSFFHTEADVKLAGDRRSATLTCKGKKLTVMLEGPGGAIFTVMAAEPLPSSPQIQKQADNSKRRKLAIRLGQVTSTAITVRFER